VRIRVDTDICSGQARCNATAPHVYVLNDEGYNDSDDTDVSEGDLADASRGALACPEGAITLVDAEGTALSEAELRSLAGLDKR
jgi:ferredoxin